MIELDQKQTLTSTSDVAKSLSPLPREKKKRKHNGNDEKRISHSLSKIRWN